MVQRIESAVSYGTEVENRFAFTEGSSKDSVSDYISAVIEVRDVQFSSFAGGLDDGGLTQILSEKAEDLTPECDMEDRICRMEARVELDGSLSEATLVLRCPLREFAKQKDAKADEAACKAHHSIASTEFEGTVSAHGEAYKIAKATLRRAEDSLERVKSLL